jgi:hypothetical protein
MSVAALSAMMDRIAELRRLESKCGINDRGGCAPPFRVTEEIVQNCLE